MQIIWDPTVVDQLRKSQTILELETFQVEDKSLTAYCVLPADKVLNELSTLDHYMGLHNGFVQALKENNQQLCNELAEHLLGRFGGELDSFYNEIVARNK
jgi:hypothetical protein